MRQKIFKIIPLAADGIFTLLTIMSIICVLSIGVSKILTGTGSVFGYRLLHVVSDSMEPTIMTGDWSSSSAYVQTQPDKLVSAIDR